MFPTGLQIQFRASVESKIEMRFLTGLQLKICEHFYKTFLFVHPLPFYRTHVRLNLCSFSRECRRRLSRGASILPLILPPVFRENHTNTWLTKILTKKQSGRKFHQKNVLMQCDYLNIWTNIKCNINVRTT